MNILNLFNNLLHFGHAANDANMSENDIRHAIEELQSFTDRELDDIGLARGEIEYAVRHGRAGIDDTTRHAA